MSRRTLQGHTVFVRGFATTSLATHLTLTYGFPHIWLSEPGGCIGPTEPLAECQRHSSLGLIMHNRGSNPQPFDYRPSKRPLHHQLYKLFYQLKINKNKNDTHAIGLRQALVYCATLSVPICSLSKYYLFNST